MKPKIKYARSDLEPKAGVKMPPEIPIARPLLPKVSTVLERLAQIDERQIYSNNGPLLREFEDAFSKSSGGQIAMVGQANGTLAIQTAILALTGFPVKGKPICLMPSFTFSASVAAVMSAGYQPYFLDVDRDTWMLDPARLKSHPSLMKAGLILVVGAFGDLPDLSSWKKFEQETKIPVIVDGAACSDAFLSGAHRSTENIPVTLSFHATKPFGLGEGGAVLCDDKAYLNRVRSCTNFGFNADRLSNFVGTNSKMSEFMAAMGLTLLEQWPTARARMRRVVAAYQEKFRNDRRFKMVSDWVTPYPHIMAKDAAERFAIINRLDSDGIGHRRWWQFGCHAQPAYQILPSDPLPVTKDVVKRIIGLPFYIDMSDEEIDRVGYAVNNA